MVFYFQADGDGYDNRLSLTREQFAEALSLILNKGTKDEVCSTLIYYMYNLFLFPGRDRKGFYIEW